MRKNSNNSDRTRNRSHRTSMRDHCIARGDRYEQAYECTSPIDTDDLFVMHTHFDDLTAYSFVFGL